MSTPLIVNHYLIDNVLDIENITVKKITLVFIHGWGVNSAIWEPTIQRLKQYFDIITVDLPGFGLNIDNTLSDYSLDNIVEKIQLSINKPAVYIGWSLGGLVATKLALNFPEKVLGCITVASSPCFLNKETNESIWPGIQPNVLKMFHQQLTKNTQKTIDGFLKIQAMGSPHVRQDIKAIRDLVMQYSLPTKQTLDDSLKLLETVDLREQLSFIEVPFLRLYGKFDALVPKHVIEKIALLIPNSQQHIFDKSSHAPFISHADEFNNVVVAWVKEHVI